MFYSTYPQSEALAKAIEWAEGSQIDVQSISNMIMITFRQPLWLQLMEGRLIVMDMVIYNMHKLHEASGLPVVALFPGNFCLRMDAAKSREYKRSPRKFTEAATGAMLAMIILNRANCDSLYLI